MSTRAASRIERLYINVKELYRRLDAARATEEQARRRLEDLQDRYWRGHPVSHVELKTTELWFGQIQQFVTAIRQRIAAEDLRRRGSL
jgi:hypothetical protein